MKPLSKFMEDGLAMIDASGGVLERRSGGCWVKPGTRWVCFIEGQRNFVSTNIIKALVHRGLIRPDAEHPKAWTRIDRVQQARETNGGGRG